MTPSSGGGDGITDPGPQRLGDIGEPRVDEAGQRRMDVACGAPPATHAKIQKPGAGGVQEPRQAEFESQWRRASNRDHQRLVIAQGKGSRERVRPWILPRL